MTCDTIISPNVEWSLEPSTWFGQTLLTVTVWFILLQIFSRAVASTITIWLYTFITFIFFHAILGDPFNPDYSGMTFWEQMMIQLSGSSGMTFFTIFPIALFLCAARFSHFTNIFFVANLFSLVFSVGPKVLMYIKYRRTIKETEEPKKKISQ